MKKLGLMLCVSLCVNMLSARVIDNLPGKIDFRQIEGDKFGINDEIPMADKDVYFVSANQMSVEVNDGTLSLYSVNNGVKKGFAALAVGYVSSTKNTNYKTAPGSHLFYSVDFRPSDENKNAVPSLFMRLNDGKIKEDRVSVPWTDTKPLGHGVTRYIFDSEVSGWKVPEFISGLPVNRIGAYLSFSSENGFAYSPNLNESSYMGDVIGLCFGDSADAMNEKVSKKTVAYIKVNSEEPEAKSESISQTKLIVAGGIALIGMVCLIIFSRGKK